MAFGRLGQAVGGSPTIEWAWGQDNGPVEQAQKLLRVGADPNYQHPTQEYTSLFAAALRGNTALLKVHPAERPLREGAGERSAAKGQRAMELAGSGDGSPIIPPAPPTPIRLPTQIPAPPGAPRPPAQAEVEVLHYRYREPGPPEPGPPPVALQAPAPAPAAADSAAAAVAVAAAAPADPDPGTSL